MRTDFHDLSQLSILPIPDLGVGTRINKAKDNQECTNYNSVVMEPTDWIKSTWLSTHACGGSLHKDLTEVPNLDPEGVRHQNGSLDNGTLCTTTVGLDHRHLLEKRKEVTR